MVERAVHHSTAEVHQALFANGAPASGPAKTLAETVWVLESVFERTPAQLIAALELLLAHENLVLQDADTVGAALAHFRAKKALGFSDCLAPEIARKSGHLPLGTFDRALSKLAGVQQL